jgi:hypothetical protein
MMLLFSGCMRMHQERNSRRVVKDMMHVLGDTRPADESRLVCE